MHKESNVFLSLKFPKNQSSYIIYQSRISCAFKFENWSAFEGKHKNTKTITEAKGNLVKKG